MMEKPTGDPGCFSFPFLFLFHWVFNRGKSLPGAYLTSFISKRVGDCFTATFPDG